jgi:hypothetical protein
MSIRSSENRYKALNAANFLPKNFLITLGEEVVITGFPRAYYDDKHNLPLMRGAMIASAYDVNFQGSPLFLVDANLDKGMSGSPVMTKTKNQWPHKDGSIGMMTGNPIYFLGVLSAGLELTFPNGKKEPLGLGQVWYGYLIEEIIASISKEKVKVTEDKPKVSHVRKSAK